jgi:MoaA/NifB/PqqE/SkfB family radical SAM enzyme
MMRRDVLEAAGKVKRILFPIFTNGTMLEEEYMKLLTENRNLVPVLSIEGNQQTTDARRGTGMYQKLKTTMEKLKDRGILFGASVTVTKDNIQEVLSDTFTQELGQAGCKAVVYVEYVPVDENTKDLAPDDADRAYMEQRLEELRTKENALIFIAFPGDEKTSGGCLAAGRGFFHINAHGGAEPCPFSPYSDTSLLHTSLREALQSPLFLRLRSQGILMKEHTGGCVLFQQEQEVKQLMGGDGQ